MWRVQTETWCKYKTHVSFKDSTKKWMSKFLNSTYIDYMSKDNIFCILNEIKYLTKVNFTNSL